MIFILLLLLFLTCCVSGVESPESQDPQFAGRVQWDKDVLTEGRLTLHVSRLRTSDSGFYVCDILIKSEGRNSRRCWLNVTAAAEPRPLTQTVKPHQKIQGIIALYIGLGISAVALLALFVSLTLSFLRPVYTTGIEKA
ncbi:uncharacterized protein LOC117540913 isoform X2 [Gymnodraco acuticeps]|uniref:Uncharacterized protein LOC117540913 isoform X2 n=1 Tax=Gymnodraco acuticeps TaxID=8218 RepID=A0A6P8TIB2_GYMAC|nr:uncharacterized protein LOC117540913 isoform X2 [Gymnodraco acuticeps]